MPNDDILLPDWKWVEIEKLCDFIVDCIHETPELEEVPTGYYMVRTSDIGNGFIHLKDARNVSRETYERRIQRGTPLEGDIIVSREAPLGEVGRVPANVHLCLGQRLIHYRPNKDKINPSYLLYAMLSPVIKAEFRANMGTGSVVDNLRMPVARSIQIPLPPRDQQNLIGALLSSLDDKIEENRRENETLEATARALFKSWFVNFDPVRAKMEGRQPAGMDAETAALFPDSFEESALGLIPSGWSVSTIGKVVEFAYGKALKENIRRPGQVPVYGSNGQVGWHDVSIVKAPGIVIGRKGNPGTVTWVQDDFFPIDTTFYIVRIGEIESLPYLYYQLGSLDLPSLGADSAVPGLNRNMAYMTNILVPPSEISSIFDTYVEPLFQTIGANEDEMRTLSETRDMLLPKLLSGKVRLENVETAIAIPVESNKA